MAFTSPLFELPIELRNMVYAKLFDETQATKLKHCPTRLLSVSLKPCIETELLLINRQFKSEYENEIFRTATLTAEVDMEERSLRYIPPRIPENVHLNVRSLNLNIVVNEWALNKGASSPLTRYQRTLIMPDSGPVRDNLASAPMLFTETPKPRIELLG